MTESQMDRRPSAIYLCSCELTNGEISQIEHSFCRSTHSIKGIWSNDEILALAEDGVYQLGNGAQLTSMKFIDFAIGVESFAGISPDGCAYSWGTGTFGELGLGTSTMTSAEPWPIKCGPSLVGIASGSHHSICHDSIGNIYVWGQNFERQLGLYNKAAKDMKGKCCLVEDVVFVPRFAPFSLQFPVLKISCGSHFSVAITKGGQVMTWGAGGCGQLGTGRCTRKEVPSTVELPASCQSSIVDISCGDSHVLAVSAHGDLLSWGFNKRGQLGLSDTFTRHTPAVVNDPEGVKFRKVYADGHSSAAIDDQGRLFTWGATDHQRLMHPPVPCTENEPADVNRETVAQFRNGTQHRWRPALVQSLLDSVVQSFAFAKRCSAALVLAHLQKLYPVSGPQRSFSRLEVHGCGLWDSPNVIVRFTSCSSNSAFAPRSCAGRLSRSGVIVCKPPKLGDVGLFDVSLSLDGKVFISDVLKVVIYKEFSIADLTPRLVDMRETEGALSRMTLTIKGWDVSEDQSLPDLWVKLVVLSYGPGEGGPTKRELLVKGALLPLAPLCDLDASSAQDKEALAEEGDVFASELPVSLQEGSVGQAQDARRDRFIVCDVDFSSLGTPGALLTIRSQVSLNGQDYCALSPESASIICHAFEPASLAPCCMLADGEGARRCVVTGHSFIPSSFLPIGTSVVANLSFCVDKKSDKRIDNILEVQVLNSSTIELSLPTMAQMLSSHHQHQIQQQQQSLHTSDSVGSLKSGSAGSKKRAVKSVPPVQAVPPPTCTIVLELTFKLRTAGAATDASDMASIASSVAGSLMSGGLNASASLSMSMSLSGGNSTTSASYSPLSKQRLSFLMFKQQAIKIEPALVRRTGGGRMTVSSVAPHAIDFLPPSALLLLRNVKGEGLAVTDLSYCPEDISRSSSTTDLTGPHALSVINDTVASLGGSYKLSFTCPNFAATTFASDLDSAAEPARAEASSLSFDTLLSEGERELLVDLMTDGCTPLPIKLAAKFSIFDKIMITGDPPPAPKGGYTSGQSVTVPVSGLPAAPGLLSAPGCCIVHLHGSTGEFASIPAQAELLGDPSLGAGKLCFAVPDSSSMAQLTPELRGKDKYYMISVSIDLGLSFDSSLTAILWCK